MILRGSEKWCFSRLRSEGVSSGFWTSKRGQKSDENSLLFDENSEKHRFWLFSVFSQTRDMNSGPNTLLPDVSEHQKMGKTLKFTTPKTGSEKGSENVKKWSNRGLEVDFDQEKLTPLTHFLLFFGVSVKNTELRVLAVFRCLRGE